METVQTLRRFRDTLRRAAEIIADTIPTVAWMKYAALRLGTFIMTYLGLVSISVIGLALAGIGVGVGLVVGIIPLAVFVAIRVSDALTRR